MSHPFRPWLRAGILLAALIAGPAWSAEHSVGSGVACDFADLDDAISAAGSGDTLRLQAETFSDTITIDRSLALIGGHISCLDSSPALGEDSTISNPIFGTSSIVAVTGNSTAASLSQITIEGANKPGDGGGIYVDAYAELALAQVVVRDNQAANGGGIYVDKNASLSSGSSLTLSVTGNSATGVGGGIYVNSGASLDLGGSIVDISGNTADDAGGGLYASGNANIILNNATVDSNVSATSLGGGLYSGAGTANATITISDSTFENNSATQSSGGGLFVFGNAGADKQLIINNSQILSNSANTNGGGVHLSGELTAELNNLNIDGNSAGDNGGGIYATGADGWLLADQVTVANNSAGSDGGGIWVRPGNAQFTGDFGSRTIIASNDATRGGGLFVAGPGGGTPEFVNVYFSSHTEVIDNTAAQGAGTYLDASGGHFLLFNGLASRNEASVDGGAFALRGSGKLNVDSARVSDNSALGDGGAIHATAGEINVVDTSVFGNTATNGAGLFLQDAALLFDDSSLSGNQAGVDGGGIHAASSGDTELINATLIANSAGSKGGGIYRTGTGRLTLRASILDGTVQPRGASLCDPSSLSFDRYCSEVIGNTSGYGGGIYIKSSSPDEALVHEIRHTAFLDNAGDLGSAITLEDAYRTRVETSLFSGNRDAGDDAVESVIRVMGDSRLRLQYATVADNTEVGLVVASAAGLPQEIYKSIFWGNPADFSAGSASTVNNICNMSEDGSLPGISGTPAFTPTERGRFRLGDASDALDVDCTFSTTVDLDGLARPVGPYTDLGAFEGAWGDASRIFSDQFEG